MNKNFLMYLFFVLISFFFFQKAISVGLLVYLDSDKSLHQNNRKLQCHPDTYWLGGSDGGFFLELTYANPPFYYLKAFNEVGWPIFKGEVKYDNLNINDINSIGSQHDGNGNELWSVILNNGDYIDVKLEKEKEYLSKKR